MSFALRTPQTRPMTRKEFFAWAEVQDGKYEFDGTQPVAMVGGTNNHGRIARNIIVSLDSRLLGSHCEPFGSDAGGVATTGNKVRYPEVTVSCSEVPGGEHLIPNPVVVFEVVSPSSVRIDQVVKLAEYHAVPSIKRYVLVEQDGIGVTVHAREAGEPWATTPLVNGDIVALPEIGIEVPVAEFYRGVTLDKAATE